MQEVQTQLTELVGREGSVCEHQAGQVIVGEYSCALTEDSWARVSASDRTALGIAFGQAQSRRWQEKAGGSFFWTWKMVRRAVLASSRFCAFADGTYPR